MRFIDLECGIGGFSLAVQRLGYDMLFATDHEDAFLDVFQWNFKGVKVLRPSTLRPQDVPHPDVACACLRNHAGAASFVRLLKPIMPRALAVEVSGVDTSAIWDLGYRPYFEDLDAARFGLPQRRKRSFAVAFRSDLSPGFLAFPFPDDDRKAFLRDILEDSPDAGLLASHEVLDRATRKNQRNHEDGFGYRSRILSPSDVLPPLTSRYAKDKTGFFLRSDAGPRRISVLEGKRVMGFPDDFVLPSSSNKAFALLGESTCPPVAQALIQELVDWVF